MDPKANLEEQARLATEIIALEDADDDDAWCIDMPSKAIRLAELVLALADWRSKGGAV